MLSRRRFIAASATAVAAIPLPKRAFKLTPLKASPKRRYIRAKHDEDQGGWLLYSDAPDRPREVIRRDVVDRTFGEGVYDELFQSDHWAMIDAGWFAGSDLHLPVPLADDTYDIWKAFYHPVTEAHDLLCDAFAPKYGYPHPAIRNWRQRVVFSQHPCTPRYATARVFGNFNLLCCHFELASLSNTVELVLPKELGAMRDDYSSPETLEWLMHYINNPPAERPLSWAEKMARADKERRQRERATVTA